jgi:hypothetical protein
MFGLLNLFVYGFSPSGSATARALAIAIDASPRREGSITIRAGKAGIYGDLLHPAAKSLPEVAAKIIVWSLGHGMTRSVAVEWSIGSMQGLQYFACVFYQLGMEKDSMISPNDPKSPCAGPSHESLHNVFSLMYMNLLTPHRLAH